MRNSLCELLDKPLENIKLYRERGGGETYSFELEPNTKDNPGGPLTYHVFFKDPEIYDAVYRNKGDHFSFEMYATEVSFINSESGVQPFEGNRKVNTAVIFSTIMHIIDMFFDSTPSVEGAAFMASHSKLIPVYKLLSLKVDRRGFLKWTSREDVLQNGYSWFEFIRYSKFRQLEKQF